MICIFLVYTYGYASFKIRLKFRDQQFLIQFLRFTKWCAINTAKAAIEKFSLNIWILGSYWTFWQNHWKNLWKTSSLKFTCKVTGCWSASLLKWTLSQVFFQDLAKTISHFSWFTGDRKSNYLTVQLLMPDSKIVAIPVNKICSWRSRKNQEESK